MFMISVVSLLLSQGGFFMSISMSFFHSVIIKEEGYYVLGNTGYYLLIAVLLVAYLLAALVVDRKQKTAKLGTRRLAFCGALIALGFILSYLKFEMPYGGSVTLFSMLCICLIGYFYGIKAGVLSALAYSILQFFQSGGSYMLSPMQICCDYFFAFTALGLTGFFYKKKDKLILAYVIAILARGLFHTIGGYLYWMDYMPENFPKQLALAYPIIYNYAYILVEGVITVVVLKIPAVSKMLKKLQTMTGEN